MVDRIIALERVVRMACEILGCHSAVCSDNTEYCSLRRENRIEMNKDVLHTKFNNAAIPSQQRERCSMYNARAL